MTDQLTTFPGSFQIKQLGIYPAPNGDTNRSMIDMRNLVASLNIVESIGNESIRGTMDVLDSAGLLEHYPIRGEEKIYINIQDSLENDWDFHGFVYKVDNLKASDTNDKLLYRLHFVSYQRFYSDKFRITSSHNDLVSNIASSVFSSYFKEPVSNMRNDINKDVIVEPTEGQIRCVLPYYTPSQAMKFLESRSYSSTSSTCSFRFFERPESFYFVSDEFMYRKAKEEDKIFEFTSDDNIPQTGDTFIQRMLNMNTVTNANRFDTFDDLHGGTYANKIVVMDIVNRTINLKEPAFKYTDVKDSWFRGLQDDIGVDRHTDTFIEATFTDDNARRFVFVKDYVEDNAGQLRGEQFIPQIASNRLSYMKHLNSIRVTSKSPGRLDITCGDFIDLKVMDYYAAGADKTLNKQLSGVYLVESVTRSFNTKDVYTNNYTLLKRNWNEDVDTSYLTVPQTERVG